MEIPTSNERSDPTMIQRNMDVRHTTFTKSRSHSFPANHKPWIETLKMIHVFERSNYVCLYEKVWNWRSDGSIDRVGSLVQFFVQFSREIDDGEISYVNFELCSTDMDNKTKRRTSGSNQLYHPTQRNYSQSPVPVDDSMQMLCTRNDQFLAVLFYDTKYTSNKEYSEKFIQLILLEFSSRYTSKLEEYHDLLNKTSQGVETNSTIKQHFQDFDDTVESLKKKWE